MRTIVEIWLMRLIRCGRGLLTAGSGIVMACMMMSCSLDDPRDICCAGSTAMRYTYLPYGREQFSEYISSLRHFLFDASGEYIGEIAPGADLQYQPLSLPEGRYTMVTVGNASDATELHHIGEPHLDVFSLSARQQYRSLIPSPPEAGLPGSVEAAEITDPSNLPEFPFVAYLDNGDELYWGAQSFAVDKDGLATAIGREAEDPAGGDGEGNPSSTYGLVTPMNNIHCHLRVRVEWSNLPPFVGDYEMELEGVASRYSLHPDRGVDADGFIVPEGSEHTSHRIRVPLRSRELDGEFVTLRLSDARIPILRILFANRKVAPDIDLSKAFRTWGWRPDRVHVQKYAILVRINSDGSADVFPTIDGSVEDWIDGGSFG